ncbi:MlaD family protein [Paucibacter soli]|uniref:MlaD family protein n=1 Tax=Paucibacter soli TaxID=3133433 RepID=UPI0030A644AF
MGAFVLLLGGLLIAGLLWLAAGGAMRKHYALYAAIEDESVAGLNLNAPVKLNGVDVGMVREIRLDPANPQRVRLLFAIEIGTPIKQDTTAVLKTQGLTGIAYVELSGGTQASPVLLAPEPGRYPQIRTKPSLSARLENVLTEVLAKLDRTSSNVDAILSDANRQAFSSSLADIASITHTLAARGPSIDAGLADAARTLANSAHASTQFGPLMEQAGRSAMAVEAMGQAATLASQQAGKTVQAVGADLRRFSAEALPELQSLMLELQRLSVSLQRLSAQTERNPSGLLLGRSPVPPGPGETGASTK